MILFYRFVDTMRANIMDWYIDEYIDDTYKMFQDRLDLIAERSSNLLYSDTDSGYSTDENIEYVNINGDNDIGIFDFKEVIIKYFILTNYILTSYIYYQDIIL